MELFYDPRDDRFHEQRGSQILYWLDDLGAKPLNEARPDSEGFLFAGARPMEDYRRLVEPYPRLRDRLEERAPLLRLDCVLGTLEAASAAVPTPRTWRLPVDVPLPEDLTFPLFLRTAETSWKRGGRVGRADNWKELEAEAELLRRALGWDSLILARQWLDLEPAGEGAYGPVPKEVRVWIVDGVPFAWSFHHLATVKAPRDFPPTASDLAEIAELASRVGACFRSRLVAADFAKQVGGGWWLIEAGAGSCAGTEHEAVFKAVARRLLGESDPLVPDAAGGPLSAVPAIA